jgi:hypothetical protein
MSQVYKSSGGQKGEGFEERRKIRLSRKEEALVEEATIQSC